MCAADLGRSAGASGIVGATDFGVLRAALYGPRRLEPVFPGLWGAAPRQDPRTVSGRIDPELK